MKKPDFYCENFISCHNNLPKFQPDDCKEQCHGCMDVIIDHHFNKKITMTNEQREKALIEIIKHYGENTQRFKLLEEVGEFSVELARTDLGRNIGPGLVGETADLLNMIDQLMILNGPEFRNDVEQMMDCKIRRTLKRIENETKNK